MGHTDIIICLDISTKKSLFLTGAKDNQIRLWQYDPEGAFQKKLECLAVYKGHNENVSGVCFAPRKQKFFASVSQDNTLKVWKIE